MLLTPPDQVAVERANGSWYRRPRVQGDAPAPYTLSWYHHYLRRHDLPSFFLTQAHVTMLADPAESQLLELSDNLPPLAEPPAAGYLQRRFTQPVQHLQPGAFGADETYTAVLDASLIARMVRRFPAVLANSTTFDDYRVYVLPCGHIEIRYGREHATGTEREVEQAELPWLPETNGSYLASYIIENERDFAPPAPTVRDRTQDRQVVEHDGGLVDLDERPAGIGILEWFDAAVDAVRARNLGLDSPDDVLRARTNGTLTNVPVNQRPWTVWWPERRYLNPAEHPQGSGRWEYYTTESERLAWTNLGGQEAFPENPRPTAIDIYTRRLVNRALNRADDTDEIDIVWVPAVPTAPTRPPPTRPPPRTSSSPSTTAGNNDIVDADSGLTHQPKNRGETDQTGIPHQRKLQTIKINGKLFTVDRSRAHANDIQEWKSWSIKSGKFYQWPKYANLDWTKPNEVEKMNKWREQSLTRLGFPAKRKEPRADYSQEERDWVFEFVKRANGQRPPDVTMAELTRRFNARFGGSRLELGVQSLYDRLREEYRTNNGRQKPHRRRDSSRRSSQPQPEPEPEPSEDESDYGQYDGEYDDDEE